MPTRVDILKAAEVAKAALPELLEKLETKLRELAARELAQYTVSFVRNSGMWRSEEVLLVDVVAPDVQDAWGRDGEPVKTTRAIAAGLDNSLFFYLTVDRSYEIDAPAKLFRRKDYTQIDIDAVATYAIASIKKQIERAVWRSVDQHKRAASRKVLIAKFGLSLNETNVHRGVSLEPVDENGVSVRVSTGGYVKFEDLLSVVTQLSESLKRVTSQE